MMRISNQTDQLLDRLSEESSDSKQDLMEKAMKLLMRTYFLEKTNKEYAELKNNESAWADEESEREIWDITLYDGLDDVIQKTKKKV